MFYLLEFPRDGYTEYYAVDSYTQTCSTCKQRIEDTFTGMFTPYATNSLIDRTVKGEVNLMNSNGSILAVFDIKPPSISPDVYPELFI